MKKLLLLLFLIPAIFIANSSFAEGYFDFDLVLSKARETNGVNLLLDNNKKGFISKAHAEKINDVRQKISAQAGIYPKFMISSDMQSNAYASAASGQGVITITYGLLQRIGTDYDALAAVIGHEFAHLTLDHSATQSSVNAIVDILGTIALVAIDASWGGAQYNRHRELHKVGLNVGKSLSKAAYSRDDEYDADAKGVEYMLYSGYSIDGAFRMHNNIIPSNSGWFDTHPSSSNRVAYIQKTAEKFSHLVKRNNPPHKSHVKIARNEKQKGYRTGGGYVPSNKEKSFTQENSTSSLRKFKDGCRELGFTENTENFGLCVLKLHKKDKGSTESKKSISSNKKIEGTDCKSRYDKAFVIDCENLPYRTGGGYKAKNKTISSLGKKQIGIILDVKPKYKYIIFSSITQKDIPIGSKLVLDDTLKVSAIVSRHFEGFYSAKVEFIENIKKGQKIYADE